MADLLRMDLRRIVRGKSFYVILASLSAVSAFVYVVMYLAVTPEAREMAAGIGFTMQGNISGTEEVRELSLLAIYYMTNVGDGLFSVLTCIFAAIFVCTELESGFIKNIGVLYHRKGKYILSKILCLSLVNLALLAFTYLLTWLLNQCLGRLWTPPASNDLLLCAAASWLVLSAMSALVLLVSVVSRSKAVSVGAALCIGSGLLINALRFFLEQFGWEAILNKTMIINLVTCNTLVEQGKAADVLAVGIGFLILYTAISGVVMTKKDVC